MEKGKYHRFLHLWRFTGCFKQDRCSNGILRNAYAYCVVLLSVYDASVMTFMNANFPANVRGCVPYTFMHEVGGVKSNTELSMYG